MKYSRSFAAIACALLWAHAANAQTSQWSAQLFVRATPSPFFADWERNPQFATLTVNYTGTASTQYTLSAEVRGAKRGIISKATSGPYNIVLGPTSQIISSSQLACFSAENVQAFVDQIVRSGVIPEDQYTLTVKVLDDAGHQLAQTANNFTIALPDPPRLTYPSDGASLTTAQPMLQWLPVQVPPEIGVEYSIRIVEVLDQQTPQVAMRANAPIFEQTVSGTTHLLYPIDALPLEEGKRYAWQVEALDRDGNPITSAHRTSELWLFSRPTATQALIIAGAIPDTATLIPGVARLTGLRRANASAGAGDALLLNGDATLELTGQINGSTRVQMSGIQIDRSSLSDAAITGGHLSGSLSIALPGSPIELRSVSYSAAQGVRVGARVTIPGHEAVDLAGDIELTPGGAYGVLTTPNNFKGWQLSNGAVDLQVNSIRVALPEAEVVLRARVRVFGQNVCDDVLINVTGGSNSATVGCPLDLSIPLVSGAALPALRLRRLDGRIDLQSNGLSAPLTASADLNLTADGSCSAGVELMLDAAGAHSTRIDPFCQAQTSGVTLGAFNLKLSNLSVSKLQYASGSGFDFALQLDGQPSLASAGSLWLPAYTGITATPAGLQFPVLAGPASGSLSAAGFELQTTAAHTDGFLFPWSSWSSGAGSSRLSLTGSVSFQQLDASAPACLTESFPAKIDVTADVVDATIAAKSLSADCTRSLGGGTDLHLRRIGGHVTAKITALAGPLQATPVVWADVALPGFFTCTSDLSLGETPLAITADGSITGRVSGLSPACQIALPAVALGISDATFELKQENGALAASLGGDARGSFSPAGQPVPGAGRVDVDLINGRLKSGRIVFDGPFEMGLPRSAPALLFRVPQAVLDTTGLLIDGRGTLLLGGGNDVAATFDRLLINPLDFTITSGQTHFDAPFALVAAISDSSLSWNAKAAGADPGTGPALRIDLPQSATLGNSGLTANGSSSAALSYQQILSKSTAATFSSDFALRISPFAVTAGSIDVSDGPQHLATIDAGGFHADALLASGGLPDHIGLPAVNVAYLDIAGGANGRPVDVQRNPDGTIHITSKNGVTSKLVLTGLGSSTPPQVDVSVDLTLDAAASMIRAGSLSANLPAALDLTARGLPFVVDAVSFNGSDPGVLTLQGRPILFGAARGAPASVALPMDANARITGHGSTVTHDVAVIEPGARRFAFNFDSVAVDVDATPAANTATFSYDAGGALDLLISGTDSYRTPATLNVSPAGVVVSTIEEHGSAPATAAQLGALSVALSAVRISRLSYTPAGWDFALDVDAKVGFKTLPGVDLPVVENIPLTRAGLSIPAFSVPEIKANATALDHFAIQPVALRSSGGLVDWFGAATTSTFDVAVDVQLSMPGAAGSLSGAHLTFLNARYNNNQFGGKAEPLTLATPANLPIGDAGGYIRVTGLSGSLGDSTFIALRGTLIGGGGLQCGSNGEGSALPDDAIRVSANGSIAGTGTMGACSLQWTPVFAIWRAPVFTVAGSTDAPTMTLDGTATAAVQKLAGGLNSVDGRLSFDVGKARLFGNNTFSFTGDVFANTRSVAGDLAFAANAAVLSSSGLMLKGTGTAQLRVATRAAATSYNDLLISLPEQKLVSGSVSFTDPLTLGAFIADNGTLSWEVRAPSGWDASGRDQLTVITNGAVLTKDGLTAQSASGGRISYRSRDTNTEIALSSDTRFAIYPAQLTGGKIDFTVLQQAIGSADRNGFSAGPLLAAAPLPKFLVFPSADVASILLRDDNGTMHVEALPSGNDIALHGIKDATVYVNVPGIGNTPLQGKLDVVIDAKTFLIKSGSLELVTTDLKTADARLQIKRMVYSDDGDGFKWHVDAQPVLPAILGRVNAQFTNLGLGARGIDGTATAGTFSDAANPGTAPIGTATSGTVSIDVAGVRVSYTNGTGDLKLSGVLRSAIFASRRGDRSSRAAIPFTGVVGSNAVAVSIDASKVPTLPVLESSFEPAALGSFAPLSATVTDNDITLTANGVLRMPKLAQDFALTLANLTSGTKGVSVGGTQSQTQSFTLFGAKFTAQTAAGDNLAKFEDDRLVLNLQGDIQFLGGKGRFRDLNVAVDGVVKDNSSMVRGDTLAINKAVRVTKLAIVGGKLVAHFDASLPQEFATSSENFDTASLVVGVDGTQERTTVELRNELAGIRSSSHANKLLQQTVHARHVRLNIPKLDGTGLTLEAVGDAYIQNKFLNRVRLGNDENGQFVPGISIDANGVTSYQNFLLKDTILVDVKKVLELTVYEATVPRAEEYEIGLGGRIALAIGSGMMTAGTTGKGKESGGYSGSALAFRNLYLSAKKLDFSDAAIDGGTLNLADGSFVIDVSRFRYSEDPTTIKVMAEQKAPGTAPGVSDSTTIAVANYVEIGGSICIGGKGSVRRQGEQNCIFAGGFDKIMYYEEAGTGKANLIVQKARLLVQNSIGLTIDMTYREVAGGTSIAFAGTGSMAGVNMLTAAGLIENGDEFRVGAFLAVPTAFQIGSVTVTQVGGGFFWNPRQENLDMIRRAAITNSTGESSFRMTTEPARFAIFLYGQAIFVNQNVAVGRALLTVTDKQFRLDANVGLLGKPNSFYGTAAFVVGFQKGYVEGNIDMHLIQPGIMRSQASLAFFAYGSNSWGVIGHSQLEIFPASAEGSKLSIGFTMGSDLFIGPKGFVASIEYDRSFSFVKLISADGGMKGMVWYYSPSSEFGAYVEIGVSVSVLGGLASASGSIQGALVLNDLPTIYASGSLEVTLFWVGSWSGSVWASLNSEGIDGGFGSDDAMEKAIATAQKIRQNMEDSKKQVSAALQTAQAASMQINLSQKDVLDAFVGLSDIAKNDKNVGMFNSLDGFVFGESLGSAFAGATDPSQNKLYNDFLATVRSQGMPAADTTRIQTLASTAQSKWTDTRQKNSKADATIKSIQITVQQAKAASIPKIGDNPAKASFAAPVAEIQIQGNDTIKVLHSGPSFDLDPTAADAAKAAAASASAKSGATADAVLAEAKSIDESLEKVTTALSGGDASLQGVLGTFGDARSATARVFGEQLDYLAGASKWSVDHANLIKANEPIYTRMANAATKNFQIAEGGPPIPLVARQLNQNYVFAVAGVTVTAKSRVALIARALNQPGMVTDFENAMKLAPLVGVMPWDLVLSLSKTYYDAGYQIYVNIPFTGLTTAATALQNRMAAVRDTMHTRMAPIENAQLSLSTALDGVYDVESQLAGLAYDLYDRYVQIAPDGAAKTEAKARLDKLRQGLTAPSMQPVSVSVHTNGSLAQIDYSWRATHPIGVTEYLFRDDATAPRTTDPYFSNGTNGNVSLIRSQLDETDPAKSTQTRTFSGSARGGYGVRAFQSATYTINYQAAATGTLDSAKVTADAKNDDTPPPPPVVTIEGVNARNNILWTWPGATLKAKWVSDDPESGVSSYSVAIGTKPGSADIRAWQDMGGRTEQILGNIDLHGAKAFYVSAIAKNGKKVAGKSGSSAAIVMDTTPAVIAPVVYAPPPPLKAMASSGAPSSCSYPANSAWNGQLKSSLAAPARGSRVLNLPAITEDESGIRAIYWRTGATAVPFDGPQGWNVLPPTATTVTVTGSAPADYRSTLLTIAVVNYAGLSSTRTTAVQLPDATPPTAVSFCAALTLHGFKALISSRANDPESGIIGYQYRVTNPGLAVFKDWPQSGVDFSDTVSAELVTTKGFALGTYYVDMRAVNYQNSPGPATRIGPVYVDTTPPLNASPNVVATPSQRTFTLTTTQRRGAPAPVRMDTVWGRVTPAVVTATLNATPDPESGTPTVEYAVASQKGFDSHTQDIVPWTTVQTGANVTLLAARLGLTQPATYYLWLRTTNGAGLKSKADYRRIAVPRQIAVESK